VTPSCLASPVRTRTPAVLNAPRSHGEGSGELAALRRSHIDLDVGTLRVELAVVELVDGSLITGPPKSEADRRIITLPSFVLPEIVRQCAGLAS
jgi:hypothetical protein